MTDRVEGYDDGYRRMVVTYATSKSREYLIGYVQGTGARINDERKDHADQSGS